jgi:hypothetical protein
LCLPMVLFPSLYNISVLFHCILWSSSKECSAIFDLVISPIFVFCLCFRILVFNDLTISPTYLFPLLHGILHIQSLDSCFSYLGSVLVRNYTNYLFLVSLYSFIPLVTCDVNRCRCCFDSPLHTYLPNEI